MLTRLIPSTGEPLPAIGLGTWQTFDVGANEYPALQHVLSTLHAAGGRLIDSSPMYGRAETAVGNITSSMPGQDDFFYATKVWTRGLKEGERQMEDSFQRLKRRQIDLMQIHNLLDWQTHLPLLRRWKEEGRIRYLGITHYQDANHADLLNVLQKEPFDFVQFNYSIVARQAEQTLLPYCLDHGIATLINRPFGEGSLFKRIGGKPLPAWGLEAGYNTWGAFFLAFLLAHPGVTCVIPATGNPQHAANNLAAGATTLPDESFRKKMSAWVDAM